MKRLIILGIIMFPAIVMDFAIYRFNLNWVSSGIFEFDIQSIGSSFYLIFAGIFKLWILGIMYWYFIYLLVSTMYFLVKRRILELPISGH